MASSTASVPRDTEQPATRAMDVDDDEARLVAPVAGAGATLSASQSGGRSSSTTYSKRKPMCMLGVITMAVIVPVAILLGVALAPSPECPHCVIPKFPHFAVPKQTVQPVATTPTVPGVKNRKPQMECHGMAEAPQIIVVRGADVYTPEHLGVRDIVVAGNTIVGIYTSGSAEVAALSALGSDVVSLIDAEGLIATPGLVDIHVHLTGGGGEKGPASRTPSASLEELLLGALTTVVGVLGTDAITRHPSDLLATVNAMNTQPMTAYMYTGSYIVPAPTILGSVQEDIALIAPVVGIGEVAVSDHRGSQIPRDVFRTLVADARRGGMLGGKAGVVYCHVGSGERMLDDLWDIVHNTPLPISQLLPTHITRTTELVNEGLKWIAAGGNLDFSAGSHVIAALKAYHASNASALDHVSISSDAYGSLPHYDPSGALESYSYASPGMLLGVVQDMVLLEEWPLEQVLPTVTRNPALFTGLADKGELKVGHDGDIVLLSQPNVKEEKGLEMQYVIARGMIAATPHCVAKGLFE